jgi:hypothetical protein
MSQESLAELARQIMAQGFDERTAGLYAALIGDTPLSDGQGNLVIRDIHGRELARIKCPAMFSDR